MLIDEDAEHEFKATHLTPKPVQKIIDLSYTYVNAFLNTSGGTLYCGVTDDGYVVGNLLNRDQRDHIRKSFDSLVLDSFWPCLDTRMASIHMIKVLPSPEVRNALQAAAPWPPAAGGAGGPRRGPRRGCVRVWTEDGARPATAEAPGEVARESGGLEEFWEESESGEERESGEAGREAEEGRAREGEEWEWDGRESQARRSSGVGLRT